MITYCDVYKCEDCPRYADDCDGSAERLYTHEEAWGMCDLISRADAIEAVCKWGTNEERKGNLTMTMVSVKQCVADILSTLPSAELPKGDLISRRWLLDLYGDYIGDNGDTKYHVPLEVVRQNIIDAPSTDAYFTDGNKIAEWIPCSERLPKEKQEVYVTVYFIEGDTGRAYGYMDGFGRWHLYSTVEGTLNSGYEVTAWMPLPMPYREDSEV